MVGKAVWWWGERLCGGGVGDCVVVGWEALW